MPSSALAVRFEEGKIDEIFQELDQSHLPGAAVGISIHGVPVYRKGFGLASMELPNVLSPTMRMRIASVTKHFTCLAYLLLCEEGAAGVDDSVLKYLPEIHPVAQRATMRQLMGHTSGLRDSKDICLQFNGTGRQVSSADLFSYYRDIDDSNFAPGTGWCYNNGGYLMLSVAIERITGRPFEDVLRERIFEPLGMHETMVRRTDTDFVANSATLHMTRSNAAMYWMNMSDSCSRVGYEKSYAGIASAGEGGIVSTVDDMLRWLAHMDEPMVGKNATWSMMKTPQTLINGTSTGYGLGLMIGEYRGVETLSHGGGVMGGNAQMLKVPAAGLDVVVMTNRQDVIGIVLADKILDACLPDLQPVRKRKARPFATGTFLSSVTGRVIQLYEKQGQQIGSIDGHDKPFEFDDEGVLRTAGVLAYEKQTIAIVGNQGNPSTIRFSDFGNDDELSRVRPVEGRQWSSILGRYTSRTTRTTVTVARSDSGPVLSAIGPFGSATFTLECIAEDIWRARSTSSMPWGGIVSFSRDCTSFRFSSFRTRALTFQRIA